MKLLLKQRYFTLLDNYKILNESGKVVYVVESQLAVGHYMKIYDASNKEVAAIRQKLLAISPTFKMYLSGRYIGCICKEFTLFKPTYTIDYNGWQVSGDIFALDYTICDSSGRQIANVSKELNWTDTYSINVRDPSDALCALMLVLAIDAEKCKK